uniref:Uncharacterized protein n=1 Tax=Rangifer tarandus platyrhynchus TaxID=3082113 RepID=A0ACB0E4E0_RANTA|nr:unnamed protein product [Rangifer tarandus platyrhynchus]
MRPRGRSHRSGGGQGPAPRAGGRLRAERRGSGRQPGDCTAGAGPRRVRATAPAARGSPIRALPPGPPKLLTDAPLPGRPTPRMWPEKACAHGGRRGTCARAGRRRAEAKAGLRGDRPLRAAALPARAPASQSAPAAPTRDPARPAGAGTRAPPPPRARGHALPSRRPGAGAPETRAALGPRDRGRCPPPLLPA